MRKWLDCRPWPQVLAPAGGSTGAEGPVALALQARLFERLRPLLLLRMLRPSAAVALGFGRIVNSD